jgi:hypothetical protein
MPLDRGEFRVLVLEKVNDSRSEVVMVKLGVCSFDFSEDPEKRLRAEELRCLDRTSQDANVCLADSGKNRAQTVQGEKIKGLHLG